MPVFCGYMDSEVMKVIVRASSDEGDGKVKLLS